MTTPPEHVLRRAIDDADAEFGDEEEQEEATADALDVAGRATPAPTKEQLPLLGEMKEWADTAKGRSDSKADILLDWLEDVVRPKRPGGKRDWSDERVIIFTEYRDTHRWLQEQLAARDLAGERLAMLYGGMDSALRERIKAEFQASPDLSPVRILLATDAASEGIDLQLHCHRLVHYEIPWNPNRLEQRNGRIDRHGQPSPEVLIYHFVSAGYEKAEPGSLEADLEFLFMAAKKIEAIREDLGSVGPVIAEQVEEAMLGRRRTLETEGAEKRAVERKVLKVERDLRQEIARLRERLDESITELRLSPENVERVVRTALELAHQPPLKDRMLERPGHEPVQVFEMPQLTGSWARAGEGLAHPVTGDIRPITFDHEVAAGHDDVVLVHLQHRLVQQSLRLLRAEIWATDATMARAAARVIPGATVPGPAVVAHGRLVITGADGHRLHEEVVEAGGVLRDGRLRRLSVGEVEKLMAEPRVEALDGGLHARLIGDWDRYRDALFATLERRARDRAESLQRSLQERAEREVETITHTLTELRRTIEAELEEPEAEQLALFTPAEREQLHRDIEALRRRLEVIPDEIETETAAIRRRYADPEPRLFPAAVTFLIPEEQAR